MSLNQLTEYTATEAVGLGVQTISLHPDGTPGTVINIKAPDFMQAFYTEIAELAGKTILYLSTEDAAYLNGRWIDASWDLEELKSLKEKIMQGDMLKTALLGSTRVEIGDEMKRMMAAG